MVSMSSESSDDSVSFCLETECPGSIYDSDFCGKHDERDKVCFHRLPLIRMVAFEGTDTSRKYLGCGAEGANCGYVRFVDPEWPVALKKALLKLWSLYKQCKTEKKQVEDQLRVALEEKDKAIEAMVQIELQTADIVSEYKDKTDEAKKKLKKFRKYVIQNDNRLFYGVCAIVFLVGLLLGGWCSK